VLAATSRAIVSYHTGKRDCATTDDFVQDLRERILGSPEFSREAGILMRPRSAMGAQAHNGDPVFLEIPSAIRKRADRQFRKFVIKAGQKGVGRFPSQPISSAPSVGSLPDTR
jgi:hypothetical protein